MKKVIWYTFNSRYSLPFLTIFYISVTPVAACTTDFDCANPDKCDVGTCRDACHVAPCGINAICKSRAHASSCTCPIGYTGDPRVRCTKSKCSVMCYCIFSITFNLMYPKWLILVNILTKMPTWYLVSIFLANKGTF